MLDKQPSDNQEIVARIFAQNAGDDEQIEIALLREAKRNSSLAQEFILLGVKQTIRSYYSFERSTASRALPDPAERERRAQAREDLRSHFWDRYSLFGHMSLKDARAEDLRESAAKRKQMASTNMRRARFELAVASRMGESKRTVGSFFDGATIDKLAEQYNAG